MSDKLTNEEGKGLALLRDIVKYARPAGKHWRIGNDLYIRAELLLAAQPEPKPKPSDLPQLNAKAYIVDDLKDEPEPTYPCAKCGAPRTADEGGTTFTVCDKCWDEEHGKCGQPEPTDEAERLRGIDPEGLNVQSPE